MDIVQLMLNRGAINYNPMMAMLPEISSVTESVTRTDINCILTMIKMDLQGVAIEIIQRLHIESLVNLYDASSQYRSLLDDSETLHALSKIHNLKGSDSFQGFVEQYDRKYLTIRCDKYYPTNLCLEQAAIEGNMEIVQLMLDRGANSYDHAMANAARGGHIKIVQLMLDQGANSYNWAMDNAAGRGHMEIVQLMLDRGATDYNGAMENAARGGHIKIVQLMLDRGATNYGRALEKAIGGKHMEIIQLMLDQGAGSYNWIMMDADFDGDVMY